MAFVTGGGALISDVITGSGKPIEGQHRASHGLRN